MVSRLLEIPTELIYSIFSCIKSQNDLLNLAMTCREIYHISLDVIFARYHMDPGAPTISLNIHDKDNGRNNITCLPALCVWLRMRPRHKLKRLEFRYGGYPDLKGVGSICKDLNLLRSYVAKLASVDDVNLVLTAPTEATTPDIGEATVELLRAILESKCVSLTVMTKRLIDTRSQDEDMMPSHSGGLFLDGPTNWVWRKVTTGRVSQNPNGRLTTCIINTYPVFLRQFYYDALQSNSSTLEELCLYRVFDGEADLGTMMRGLRLPRLRTLRIHSCEIYQESVIDFLSYHRDLTFFKYHHVVYPETSTPVVLPRLSPNLFNNLKELITTPRHLKALFPPVSSLPVLRVLTIQIEVDKSDFSAAEEALADLQTCTGPIDLTLHITVLGFGPWMETIEALPGGVMAASDQRPERLLFPIRSLTLYNAGWGWNAELIMRVMRWVLIFPALEEVTFDAHPSSPNTIKLDRRGVSTLTRDIKQVCTKRIKVTIKSPAADLTIEVV